MTGGDATDPPGPCAWRPGTRLAAVDLGVNAIDALVAEVTGDGFTHVARAKEWLDLGRHGLPGRLGAATRHRALAALGRIGMFCEHHRARDVVVGATSALRAADDCQDLVAAAWQLHGLRVEVLDPQEEGALIGAAVLRSCPPSEPAWLADIGGGNLLLAQVATHAVSVLGTAPLGVATLLAELGGATDAPFAAAAEASLRRRIGASLGALVEPAARPSARLLVAVAGTAAAVAGLAGSWRQSRLEREIEAAEVSDLCRAVLGTDRQRRLELPTLDYRRVDQIVPGVVLLDELLRRLGADRLRVVQPALREGLMLRRLRGEPREEHRLAPDGSGDQPAWGAGGRSRRRSARSAPVASRMR